MDHNEIEEICDDMFSKLSSYVCIEVKILILNHLGLVSKVVMMVDEKNEMKNSIKIDDDDYDTSESVDNDDDYGYVVKDIITIYHDIMNTTTNKRRRN